MARQKIVAGNWKMNLGKEEGATLASEVINMVNDEVSDDILAIMCPSFIHLAAVKSLVPANASNIFVGAQNCSNKESGAFTGEVSVDMLTSYGIQYVIIGHSERREYYKEDNALLAEKTNLALQKGLNPIFCCGEVLAEREANKQIEVVKSQLEEGLFHLSAEEFANVVIAYEPVWAIGTGVTASSDQAQEMHAAIRKMVAEKYGEEMAKSTSILYGGSCKPSNAKELFAGKDVDGGLIGGASLKSRDFVDIMKCF